MKTDMRRLDEDFSIVIDFIKLTNSFRQKVTLILFSVIFVIAFGCKNDTRSKLAEVDGHPIFAEDLEKTAGKDLFQQREALYKLEVQKLNEYITASLLTREAKNRNISVSALLDQEINSKVTAVSEDEIQNFYETNKSRLRVEFNKVHDQIRDFLREQKVEKQRNDYFESLRAKAKVTMYLRPPPVYRVQVPVAGAPIRGSEKAPVTIIKFEDFQCPFCKAAQPTFKEILKKYAGSVKVVHKDLPLEAIHPLARQAAEAARCASEQGKFWQYHDQLYAVSPKLSIDELKASAKEIGLNTTDFDLCLASGKYRAAVQKDSNEGAQLGITGTPTFFINGREMSGAQPLEAFAAVIDEELGQKR